MITRQFRSHLLRGATFESLVSFGTYAVRFNVEESVLTTIKLDDISIIKPVKKKAQKRRTSHSKRSFQINLSDVSTLDDQNSNAPVKTSLVTERNHEVKLTPLYSQVKTTIDQFETNSKKHIVLTQVGSFYELYFQHAIKYAPELNLTLSSKKIRDMEIPFAGFPDHAVDKYLKMIFDLGHTAVICNQTNGLYENKIQRPVNRLITPGTVIDDSLRDYHNNNYLLTITFPKDPLKEIDGVNVGLAWADVGLGTFHVLETTLSQLMTHVSRISPSEILINEEVDLETLISGKWYPELVEFKRYFITRQKLPSARKKINSFFKRFVDPEHNIKAAYDNFKQKEQSAMLSLLHYLDECIPNYKTNFSSPTRSISNTLMQIDPKTMLDLELIQTRQGGFRTGSLVSIIDLTLTHAGSRRLKSWLSAPSAELSIIQERLSLVELFRSNRLLSEELRLLMKDTADIKRLMRRINNGKVDPMELVLVARTILQLQDMESLISEQSPHIQKLLLPLYQTLSDDGLLEKLSKELLTVIDVENLGKKTENRLDTTVIRKYWSITETVSPKLVTLRKRYSRLVNKCTQLLETYESELKANNINYKGLHLLKDVRSGEFLLEIKSTNANSLASTVSIFKDRLRDKTRSSCRLVDPEWTELGTRLVETEYLILKEEETILESFRVRLLALTNDIRNASYIIEKQDVLISFSILARNMNLNKPHIDESLELDVVDGRHIVVEEGLKQNLGEIQDFTANDCQLDTKKPTWIITGPNMGGKSTFLRQNALIVILAQIGSFVPASSARIGIVDKIFTRIGSSDNIYRNQSTFMVEMTETAAILKESTPRSLAIVDELGRGTSMREGIAIAYSCLFFLSTRIKCRTLFATHYGAELEALLLEDTAFMELIEFQRTRIIELEKNTSLPISDRIIFDHRLKPGISAHSYGLEIAELAGFPRESIEVGRMVMDRYEENR
ncbi:DNA mismatch repair protein [Komagataella phaffii]|uniref:DNA-binding protein of the mitochondria involved in repair of mitochondrial DNA n=1 Tax=Komagataella phaffii (strain GS115 / ATCC 20864) TaxID=644223 RepID=C4R218_KOMPG|nr:DNA-binding protein of the mitochondria involved in repair of mitochondrial DNA [Komagataella phaffii GS115]AOA62778.1 GQ67_00962T0 [Komagataella phaffii]AOA68039.1 GQ68_00427T0 [Komagataella phaffii GS115]CAH2447913.1 DNA mismatch repair protein [Komagataella phaffii CBS 7435]CAY69542.1 DNA-binding protein of the mitochondria involved in repair of mitochondrial DNA [Komagataella phaffii GS115]